MEAPISTADKEIKSVAPRVRSLAYPSYSALFCYDLTLKIHQTFGSTTFNTREEIAQHFKVSVSHLLSQLSSCVQYGLLEIKNKEGYKPTPLFTVIYKPLDETEKRTGLLQCFANPELYKKLITQFNNQSLPSKATGLSTILLRSHKISETGAPLAAKIFLENANDLGLIDSENVFRLGGSVWEVVIAGQPSGSILIEDSVKDNPLQIAHPDKEAKTINYVPENPQIKSNPNDQRIIPIYFKDGNEAQVILPNKFTNDNLTKIVKVLQAYIDD